MQGCNTDNKAIDYFEAIFENVQQIIELDSKFSIELEKHLINADTNPNDIESEEEIDNDFVINAYNSMKQTIENKLEKIDSIPVFANENKLKLEYEKFLKSFLLEYKNNYSSILEIIIKDEEPSKNDIDNFNSNLQHINKTLNNTLDSFYKVSDKYADLYQIDIA